MDPGLVDALKAALKTDEGVVYQVYADPLGLLTFGIGHLIVPTDPEYGQPVGTAVSEERVTQAFTADVQTAVDGSQRFLSDFKSLPDAAKLVVANMMFNLGYAKMTKFKKFRAAMERRNWTEAADEMVDSLWYKQVTTRANRLVAMIRGLVK